MENSESKTQVVEQIKAVLRSGEYSRALDLLRNAGAELSGDAELAELERLAQDGTKRKAEADQLITESQELFVRQKPEEALRRLRTAYELDKTNSLARTILANALVEHAQSIVETDWLESEKLSNQALALNPAHPTAKTILNIIVQKKETSPVDEWVSQANKLHSSGDLFAALAWVAEGLAVHPHDPKLLQIQDGVQRDQEVRRRQARRGDLDELRRLQAEIAGAADAAAKQGLVERIQTIAAKHWTDGEILSIANALLLRLGLLPQENSSTAQRRKGGTVIFHVPRVNAPKSPSAAPAEIAMSTVATTQVPSTAFETKPVVASAASGGNASTGAAVAPAVEAPRAVAPKRVAVPPAKEKATPPRVAKLPMAEDSASAVKIAPATEVETPRVTNAAVPRRRTDKTKSKSTLVIVVSVAAVFGLVAILFLAFGRKHQGPEVAKTSTPASVSAPAVSMPATDVPVAAVPAPEAVAKATAETTQPVAVVSSSSARKVGSNDKPTLEAGRSVGALVVVVGQDDARVFVNGKVQRQLTRGGQLVIPNLELKDYVVQVSKNGFQDPPQQQVRIRKGEETKLTFNLQPQSRMASLTVQGGAPGTSVLVDQNTVGTIQGDGTLNVATVNPGDHLIELRKERFKTRQFKKHFVAGAAVSLAAADAMLEAAGGELKITFSPADAKVALVKGDFLKIVVSGVPLSLDPGTYTITARTAERFTRSQTVDVVSGQSKTLDLALAPNGMSKWEDAAAWKHEGDSFTHKGGEFVLYGVPAAGTFTFSGMAAKGRLLQWVVNYTDPKNYVLFQLDENSLHRTVIRNGERRDEIIVPHKGDKKSFRTVQIRVGAAEVVHQVKDGENWTVLDRWSQPGVNLSAGKFGFYIPGNDQVALSSFAQYADLNIR